MGSPTTSTTRSDSDDGLVRVGGATAPWAEAKAFVTRYLNTPSENWSYPAYDEYPGGPGDHVSEQDLLAPTLLNAGLRELRTYYALIDALPELNDRLERVPTDVSLADATDADIEALASVIAVIDSGAIHGVRLTTLSKVLHRKRPQIFPLYDVHIEDCYQDVDSAPVPRVKGRRSWSDFAQLWLRAVQHDLSTPPVAGCWATLAGLTPDGGPEISPLRALDIVGWGLGQPGRKKWRRSASPDSSS